MIVLEIDNATTEQVQQGLEKRLLEFCKEHEDVAIKASHLNDTGKAQVKKIINEVFAE